MADCVSLPQAEQTVAGTFHSTKGYGVQLSDGNTVAFIGGVHKFSNKKITTRRVVFSREPINSRDTFQVHVVRLQYVGDYEGYSFGTKLPDPNKPKSFFESRPSILSDPQQNIAIGFIAIDPEALHSLPSDGVIKEWAKEPDVWILTENSVYHDKEKESRLNMGLFQPNSNTIGCRVNEKGYLEFIKDDKNHGVVWSKPLPMDRPLWGFVDLPIEYKILACFTHGVNPPLYHPNDPIVERVQDPVHVAEINQKITQLETALCEEINSNFRRQFTALARDLRVQVQEIQQQLEEQKREIREEMQRVFQAQLVQLQSRMQNLQPSWSIDQEHLEITEHVLGRGAYGEVRVGIYQSTRVAVKKMYDVIISDYNRELFEREMKIALCVRHPNLVLFVGAVTTGSLTIVNELMETSLRKLMEEGNLKPPDIHPISKDVACALVHLHSFPDPIVHRDVSSANVLLNTKKDGWQAKLGDFGSANFLAKLRTIGPGCVAYAAPEAGDRNQQSPKMDVYSFGVLLLEMCVGKLIDQHTLESTKVAVVTWSDPSKKSLGEWSKRCTERDPDKRPNMANFVRQF